MISATVAIAHACRSVSTFAPTLVPKTFATSLAPTPNARINAKMNPIIIIHSVDECQSARFDESGILGASVVEVVRPKPLVSARQGLTK